MIYLLVLTLISSIYFLRNLMILAGWLKSPLLRNFERYGVGDDSYTVMPELLMSFVLLLFSVTALLMESFFKTALPVVLIAMVYLVGWLMLRSRLVARRIPLLFLSLPIWYSDLRERTTREERRRIAYRWLSLPLRTRLAYSANDHAFHLWADLVILGTVTHTVEDDETLAVSLQNVGEIYY
jgi:hypothetical protein